MSTPSILTQNLPPFLSVATSLSYRTTTGYVKIPSWVTTELGGKVTISGAATLSGALAATSTAAFSGGVAINSALTLGLAGIPFKALRKSTASVAIDCTKFTSATTNVTENNITAGDIVLHVQPDASKWSGANTALNLSASVSANSTIAVQAINSGNTTVAASAMNFDFYWLDFA